ncbi:MAG: CapA family protein [Bacteroidales bacterium]|nr:CapA family protein [Bacteroidales bacterium]
MVRKIPFTRLIADRLRRMLGVKVVVPMVKSYYPQELWNPIYPIATEEQQKKIQEAVRISFCGDLILLRELEDSAYEIESGTFVFSSLFKYVTSHWKTADLAIGVFEGPMAGEEYGYTTSNCEDSIPLRINMPDVFADEVKKAGINFVTTANNHVMDQGVAGLKRTLDVLDRIGLNHTGSYRNEEECKKVKLIEVAGKKIAFLSYTFSPNDCTESFFYDEDTRYYTNGVVSKWSPFLEKCKYDVISDFERVKAAQPDKIIVLPHMGTQFESYPDEMQEMWVNLFVEQGADAVLCCHAHHVQPIKWKKGVGGKDVVVVYCPGNFINSYTLEDGDASMLVDLYFSKNEFIPFSVSFMPIYAYADSKGVYTGLPMNQIYSIQGISRGEVKHVEQLHRMVCRVACGHSLALNPFIKEHFIFADDGYSRMPVEYKADLSISCNSLTERIERANHICFIGDSITEGTVNGGYGWFEPIMANYKGKHVSRVAKGSATSEWILAHLEEAKVINADLYVLAFGCNDIRYRGDGCAMTATEFVSRLTTILECLNPQKCIIVQPWISADFDPYCPLSIEYKKNLYREYCDAIRALCRQLNIVCLDANEQLMDIKNRSQRLCALQDHINPNAGWGIMYYSDCVLKAKEL